MKDRWINDKNSLEKLIAERQAYEEKEKNTLSILYELYKKKHKINEYGLRLISSEPKDKSQLNDYELNLYINEAHQLAYVIKKAGIKEAYIEGYIDQSDVTSKDYQALISLLSQSPLPTNIFYPHNPTLDSASKSALKTLFNITSKRGHTEKNTNPYETDIYFTDINGRSLLWYAVARGDLEEIKKLELQGADFKKAFEEGSSPLLGAVVLGHLDIVKYLSPPTEELINLRLPLNKIKDEATVEYVKAAILNYVREKIKGPKLDLLIIKPELFTAIAILGDISSLHSLQNYFLENEQSILNNQVSLMFKTALINQQFSFVNELIDNFPTQVLDTAKEEAPFIAYADEQTIVKLIKIGYINAIDPSQHYKVLFNAIEENNINVLKALLANGVEYTSIDLLDNNILHHAIKNFNEDPTLLNILLTDPRSKTLIKEKNIFGKTPIDIASLSDKKIFAEIFENHQIKMQTLISKTKDIGEVKDIRDIRQSKINKRLEYHMKLNHSDPSYFSEGGYCNGYDFLFHIYATQRRLQYFFSTLALLSHWDGSKVNLKETQEWQKKPQATYHENLDRLFMQWGNDLSAFLVANAMEQTGIDIGQSERREQLQFMTDEHAEFAQIYREPLSLSVSGWSNAVQVGFHFTKIQLEEVLKYISQLPAGTCVSLGGSFHATSLSISDKQMNIYYDSNLDEVCEPIFDSDKLAKIIFNTKYRMLGMVKDENDKFEISFNMFYLSNALMTKHVNEFSCFKPDEFPSSLEDAQQFRERSPCQFTHLHIAALTGSLVALKRLLNENFCDVNAKDAFGRSPLSMAISSANIEMINALLNVKNINIDQSIQTGLLYIYKALNETELFFKIINHQNVSDLSFLLEHAINKKDDRLTEYLFTSGKLAPNPTINILVRELYPKGYCIDDPDNKKKSKLLERALQLPGVNIYSDEGNGTLIFQLLHREIPLNLWMPAQDINKPDASGDMAIHYAAKNTSYDFEGLLKLGANVFAFNTAGRTAIDIAIAKNYPMDNKVMQTIMDTTIFDLTIPLHKNQLFKLLIHAINRNADEAIITKLIKQCDQDILSRYYKDQSLTFYLTNTVRSTKYLELLVKSGVDINQPIRTNSTETMLSFAKENNIEVLIQKLTQMCVKQNVGIKNP